MKCCDYYAQCYFQNVKTAALPFITRGTRADYCLGEFTRCAIYKAARFHGIDKVPRYVSPGDRYELLPRIVENSSLRKASM